MPKGKSQPKPTEDEPEKIAECLSCELKECNNCWARGGKKRKTKERPCIEFFRKKADNPRNFG